MAVLLRLIQRKPHLGVDEGNAVALRRVPVIQEPNAFAHKVALQSAERFEANRKLALGFLKSLNGWQ